MEITRPTFGGVATGLDTNALLQGLLEIERIPLQRMQSRRSEVETQRGLLRDFNTKLVALREAARALDNRNDRDSAVSSDEEFLRYSATSSDDEIVGVSASAGATPGDVEIEVVTLARGSRRFSGTYTERDAEALAAGAFLEVGLPNGDPDAVPVEEDTLIRIEAPATGGLTLEDVRDQINTSEDNGGSVRADILQIAENEFQLVLTSTGTGLSNELSVSGDLVFQDPAERDLARNAQIRLFGQEGDATDPRLIERESNEINDVLEGITFRLKRESVLDESAAGYDENLEPTDGNAYLAQRRVPQVASVQIDLDEVEKGLQKFVSAYNDVLSFIERQTRYDESRKQAGPLSGDTTLRSVQTDLRQMVSRAFAFEANPGNPFAPGGEGETGGSITAIGLELADGGRLRLDEDKLEEALARDAGAVRQFLSGAERLTPTEEGADYDPGLAQLFATRLEGVVRGGDGILAERDEAISRRIDAFDRSIERFEFRVGQREETLIARFSELERIVAGLQSQQGFLAGLV